MGERSGNTDEPPFWFWLTAIAASLALLVVLLKSLEFYYGP